MTQADPLLMGSGHHSPASGRGGPTGSGAGSPHHGGHSPHVHKVHDGEHHVVDKVNPKRKYDAEAMLAHEEAKDEALQMTSHNMQ